MRAMMGCIPANDTQEDWQARRVYTAPVQASCTPRCRRTSVVNLRRACARPWISHPPYREALEPEAISRAHIVIERPHAVAGCSPTRRDITEVWSAFATRSAQRKRARGELTVLSTLHGPQHSIADPALPILPPEAPSDPCHPTSPDRGGQR